MKVSELIERLKEMPQENIIWIAVPYTVTIGSKEKSDQFLHPFNVKDIRKSIINSQLTIIDIGNDHDSRP